MTTPYIKNFSQFLLEQDMAIAPTDPTLTGQPGVPTKKEKPFYFIFIDSPEKDGLNKKKYPDGSVAMEFPTFSVTSDEIKNWVEKNIISTDKNKMTDSVLDIRRNNIIGIVKGEKVNISSDDVPFIEKLKNAVSTDIFGRRESEITVVFTKDDIPTTEDMRVTFIKYKKQ